MNVRITTSDEIKKILGISGTASDALVEIWNGIATEMLNETFGVAEITTHTVTDERVKVFDPLAIALRDFPVDTGETITIKNTLGQEITTYFWDKDPNEKFTIRGYTTAEKLIPNAVGYPMILASYTAGYSVVDTLVVADLTDLVGKTITVTIAGTAVTWTVVASDAGDNEINVGGTTALTAAAIATALGGTASDATVTLPLGSRVELGTATAAQLTITNATIPESFKLLVALLVGGGIAEKTKKGGVVSYSLGQKSVNFRTEPEKAAAEAIVKQWLPYFKRCAAVAI